MTTGYLSISAYRETNMLVIRINTNVIYVILFTWKESR